MKEQADILYKRTQRVNRRMNVLGRKEKCIHIAQLSQVLENVSFFE